MDAIREWHIGSAFATGACTKNNADVSNTNVATLKVSGFVVDETVSTRKPMLAWCVRIVPSHHGRTDQFVDCVCSLVRPS